MGSTTMVLTGEHGTRTGRELPSGADGSLWSERPHCGVFSLRGRRVRIEVSASDDVLFPTDCGLSLLAALDEVPEVGIRGRRVLDIGCGSGLYSVALLAAGADTVTALDVNPAAATVTARNARLNGLDPERLDCVTADLAKFTTEEPFDLIVANPPHLPYSASYATEDGLDTALIGGADGRALYDMVIDRCADLLAPGGTLVFAHSSLADVDRTVRRMAELGYGGRELQVFGMDIPLRAYAEHRAEVLRELEALQAQGRAVLDGSRFWVHVLAFTRDLSGGRQAAQAA